jgi:hypothetical protein
MDEHELEPEPDDEDDTPRCPGCGETDGIIYPHDEYNTWASCRYCGISWNTDED